MRPGRRSRTRADLRYVVLATLSGLVGAYVSGFFPPGVVYRTLVIVAAASLFVGGVAMAAISLRELGRHR